MEERNIKLENAYFRNVLNVIEQLLDQIPDPAYEHKGSRSITQYSFNEPIREDHEQTGRITVNYSKKISTEYATMAGIRPEKEPLVFECYQDGDNVVEVRGYYSSNEESSEWIKPIFEDVWQKLLDRFSS